MPSAPRSSGVRFRFAIVALLALAVCAWAGGTLRYLATDPTVVSRRDGYVVTLSPPDGWIDPRKFRKEGHVSGGVIAKGWLALGISSAWLLPADTITFYGGGTLVGEDPGTSSAELLQRHFMGCESTARCVANPVEANENAAHACKYREEERRRLIVCYAVSNGNPPAWAGFTKSTTAGKAGRDYALLNALMGTVRFQTDGAE